jgi:TonB family protein
MMITKTDTLMLRTLNRFRNLAVTSIVLYLSIAVTQTKVNGQQSSAVTSDDSARGIKLYNQGDIKGAAEALRLAVKQHKDDADAWYYLGLALTSNGDGKGARKAFEATVKLRPESADARTGLAYILLLANKLGEAESEAKRALALKAENTYAHYVIGVARLRAGSPSRALDEAEAALRINPDFSAGLLLKSQVLINIFTEESLSSNKQSSDDSFLRLRDARESLEKYLKLNANTADREVWREQLESLRVYAELSDKSNAARSIFNADEITITRRILSKPTPEYTEEARRAGVEGTVVLLAVLAADGNVKHVLLLQPLSYGLTEEAIMAARKIKFEPSIKDGRPVSQVVRLEYHFNLH